MKKINLIEWLWKTDSHEKQKPQRFARYAAMLIMLLTLGVGQMWATVTIYAVGNMQDNGGTWRDEKTTLNCHNWYNTNSYSTKWPGTSMTKWNDVSVDGHQVFKCNLNNDANNKCIFNNGSWQTNDITNLNATVKAYPYPTYLNGTWYYSPRVCKALWESDQHAYGGRIYFDNSSASWGDTYMYFVIGHGSYVGYYRITNIGNTKLYYVDLGSQSWGDSKYVAVVGNSSSKATGSGNPNNLAALTHFSDAYQYSLEYQSTYLVSMSSGTNCSQISMDYKSGGYSDFNSTQTINTVVKAAGGSYTSANSKATISITSYEMTGDGAVTKRTPSISTSAKQATVSAARTATTTLSVGDVATGYQFDGWYTAATGGTKLSESTTYTYYPTSATTVYARFSEKTFTVTVTNDGNGTTSPSGAQSNKGQITGVAISATPSDGYNFNNWTITSGTGSFADATDESTTFYPTGTATIRANFVSAATSTLTVTATTGGSITTPAAGYYSDITTTGYSIAASRSEGYKFTGWTKTAGDGAVSFANASSLSTTATITTLGDVTVTAGFAAMSNALSVSSSSVYAGSDVTLTATKTNHTLDLKYQYKIGSGSWNTITTKSGTSHTYTIPYANTYQTYYFRVVSTDGSTDIISPTQTVEVKGRITIHVKNTNSWATMKLYSWYNDGSDHATNGAWNGTTGTGSNGQRCSVHATGSQWWDVTITQTTSNAQKFILSCSTSGDQNKTADLNLSSFTHDAYYAMSTNGSSAQTLSTTTTPAAPTVSTLTAGTIRETSAVLGGNIANAAALGNDIITERGYYWSTDNTLSSSNLGVGTKVTISGTQSAAGNFSGTKSGLTAGTTYYFLAYAKNGYGTGYSSVQNFTTLSTYTVTVTAGAGGSASPSSVTAGQYLVSGTITASPSTGYTFYNWTKTSGSGTVTFTNANAASTTLKSTSTATVRANFVDMWNVKGSWDSWAAYEPMTATGVSNTYGTTKTLAAKTEYHIKVVKRVDSNSSNDKWYGVNGGTTLSRATGSVTGLEENGGETEYITFTTDVAGDYTITYLYNASVGSMKVTVGYPTAYTITYGVGTLEGCSTAVSVSPSFTSGEYVLPETDVTFSKGSTKAGYTWKGWYSYEGGTGDAWSTTDASLSLTATRTGNISVYACYNYATYTATLSTTGCTGYGSGAPANQTATYTQAMPTITPPTAANGYCFMGYWDDEEGAGTQYYNANGTSAHAWDKTSGVTLYAYFKKAEITNLVAAPGVIAPGETITITPTISPTPTGTTKVCYELQYSNGTPLPSQPKMDYDGNAVSFSVPSASATYIIQATLAKGSDCPADPEDVLSTRTTTFQVAGAHDVTVKYMCGDLTIKASEVLGEIRPLTWSDDITAPTITGYTFARWDAGDGVTIKDGSGEDKTTSTSSTIKIKAVYDGTLTAVYSKKRLIFFNNTLNWDTVVVYFYKNNSYWGGSNQGTGANTGWQFTSYPYSEGKHGGMQRVAPGSNIWYFDAEAAGVNASYVTVAFTDKDQHGCDYFYDNAKVIRRDDYNSTQLPMFVPLADQTPVNMNNNTAKYYNNGYWMNYPENSGYTLKIYNAYDATKETAAVQSIAFPYSEDLKMPLKMDVELSDGYNHDYWFMVYRNDGTYMGSAYHFKQGYQDEQTITGGNTKNKITTSAPGNYTFTLTYHDNGSGTVNYYIDVDFPIATGDYRIYYSDNATWSKAAHTKDSWYHPSHSIGKATTEAKKDTISFYIPKGVGISHTMKFQKASVTNEGEVSWEDVSGGSITIPSGVTETGVYNFIVSQPAGGASISLEKVEPYTGNFYIRTDCAGNTKWDSFKNVDHQMTYSDYAETNSGYSHYYAHWVTSGNNVKFVIANDYSMCITDTLIQDYGTVVANIDAVGALNSASASIRFMWNQATNKISRAYISGSSIISDRFLVLEGDAKMFDENGRPLTDEGGGKISGLNDNEINLVDDQNFVYEREIKVQTKARAKLTAKYNNNIQYFIGGADETVELLGGTESETKNKMRIVYDFKTNRLVTAYMPEGEITEDLAIYADLMIVREHQEAGQQLLFNGGSLSEVHTVYGVMRFNRWTLNNKNTTEPHGIVADPKSAYERGLYWISFPFEVKLSDVFGFGTYGTHWILMEYNGAKRATEGYWADSKGFWEYVMPSQRSTYELKAGTGYVLALDLDLMKSDNTSFWTNNIEQVELFFPSASYVSNIAATNVSTTVDPHVCTINRHTQAEKDAGTDTDINKNRTVVDSHWNIIGVPSYANYGTTLKDGSDVTITWHANPESDNLPFLYEWNMVDNTYTPQTGTTYPFKSMHAYIVQYNGTLKWTLASATPATPAPRRYEGALKDVEYRLELQQNEKMVDQAFVKMSNEENVSAGFSFDEDLCKEYNANKANIYTFIEGYIPAAGNTLPMSEQTTVVPVGVKIATNGEYTFAMPDGTDGIGITLIDNETGIRTPLSALDYTVNLSAGTYNKRFVLEISPIHHMPTGIENSEVSHQHSDVRKMLIDGILYIVKDGKMFDARGALVK